MTRYVIDAGAAIQLAGDDREIAEEHELLAPTLLRSQTLSLIHSAVSKGEMTEDGCGEPPRPHRRSEHPAPRRPSAAEQRVEGRRPTRLAGHVRRRVHRAHPPASGCVHHARRRSRRERERRRANRVDRRAVPAPLNQAAHPERVASESWISQRQPPSAPAGWSWMPPRTRTPCCGWATGPAAGSGRSTSPRWPLRCRAKGSRWCGTSSRGGSPGAGWQRDRRPSTSRGARPRRWSSRSPTDCRWWWAVAVRERAWPAGPPHPSAPWRWSASRSRCTRPAGPRSRG